MKTTIPSSTRIKRKRGKPATGGGILFEIRNALGREQREIGELLGISENYISKLENRRATPTSREARNTLLNLALNIPEKSRLVELQNWIEATTREFEQKPLGGKFL